MESSGIEQLYPNQFALFQLKPTTRFDDDLKAVRFYSHNKDYQYLSPEGANHWKNLGVKTRIFSNLYVAKISVPDKEDHFKGKYDHFESNEHYFQMYKYSDADRNFIVRLSSNNVASYGQRRMRFEDKHLKIVRQLASDNQEYPKMKNGRPYEKGSTAEPILIVSNWDEKSIDVMHTAIRAKFSQHQDLADMLISTKGCWLIEHTKNDFKWADGMTGKGTNYLGKLLMYVRQELIDKKEYELDRKFLKCPMDELIHY